MSKTLNKQADPPLTKQLLRFIGPVLLLVLLWQLDLEQARATLEAAEPGLMMLAASVILPLIFVKAVRWRSILSAHHIRLPMFDAYLIYFSSLFIGFLTPGRLGEFVKAVYVERSCDVTPSRAFASVLVDRLFDFYALLIVGSMALLNLFPSAQNVMVIVGVLLGLTAPLVLFMHDLGFAFLQQIGLKFGRLGRRLLGKPDSLLSSVRRELRQLRFVEVAYAILLTVIGYTLFYGQSFLLARALRINIAFIQVSFAVALGSLITLIPISISGLGTRELAIITYLESVHVQPSAALSFSLLMFFTFQIVGGAIGALAWWIKPIPVPLSTSSSEKL